MTYSVPHRVVLWGVVCAVLVFSGCTRGCEDTARRIIGDKLLGDEKKPPAIVTKRRQNDVEPNDSPGKANVFTPGSEVATLSGKLSKNDIDWYRLRALGDRWTGRVEGLDEKDGLDVRYLAGHAISEESGWQDARKLHPSDLDSFHLKSDGLVVGIRAAEPPVEYEFAFEPKQREDWIDWEPNNSTELGHTIRVFQRYSALLSDKKDVDYFDFRKKDVRGKVLSLKLESSQPILRRARFEIDSPSTPESLTVGKQKATKELWIPNVGVPSDASQVSLSVEAASDLTEASDYTVVIEQQSEAGTLEAEPNDARDRSSPLGFKNALKGYFHTGDPGDWFTVAAPDDGKGHRDSGQNRPVDNEQTGGNKDAKRDGSDHVGQPERIQVRFQSLLEQDNKIEVQYAHTTSKGKVSGTLQLDADDADSICYKPRTESPEFSFELAPKSEPATKGPHYRTSARQIGIRKNAENEPNNAIETAESIEIGDERTGIIEPSQDIDVFEFEVPKKGVTRTKRLNVGISSEGFAIEPKLLDSSEGLVLAPGRFEKDSQDFGVELPPGTYYLKMREAQHAGQEDNNPDYSCRVYTVSVESVN